MTLDDAAAILDVTEEHVKNLVLAGELRGSHKWVTARKKYKVKGSKKWIYRTIRRTEWAINGQDVRARRRRLDR